jgi:hypothetical protein
MAEMEHLRDALDTPPHPEYWERRTADGWRLVGVQWERPAATGAAAGTRRLEEVPYGMRVADDCAHLEEEPEEMEVLARMLRMIADDLSLSQVARELNRAGFRNRSGGPWTQVAAFNLLPRLIEAAPRVRTSGFFRQQGAVVTPT